MYILHFCGVTVLLTLATGVYVAGGGEDRAPDAELKPVPEGRHARLNVALMRPTSLSATKPEGVKKGPTAAGVLYGTLPLGVTAKGMFVAVTEAADSKTWTVYLDANGDGDLTNDPPLKSNERGPAAFSGVAEIMVEKTPVTLRLFRYTSAFAKTTPSLKKENPLFYHRDDAPEGKLTLGGTTYSVLLADLAATGRYDRVAPAGKNPAVALFIDRNHNGQYDRPYEQYDLSKPFTIGGKTYELDRVAADGSRLLLKASKQVVREVPLPLDTIGQLAPGFEAAVLGGKTVKFPTDFKGKIVLLDFWATGCGPCMALKPDLVRTYARLKARGFEIVGINLDPAHAKKQVLDACKKYGMTWPQVFEGKDWEGAIAGRYNVQALPSGFLVDGTTGKLLATPEEIRRDGAGKTTERVLAIRDALRVK